jgi:hypothetical protein
MLMNLALGSAIMVLCLFLQSLLVLAALRYYKQQAHLVNNPSFWSSIIVIKSVMLLLFIGNLMQIAIWAGLFIFLGEFQQFSEAFYHSAVNFSTLGYGDLVMSAPHRLLGPLESINGVLMIGVSSAALISTYQDAMHKTLRIRQASD